MFKGAIGAIDFDVRGLTSGVISIPHSVDRSPYYQIQIPYWRVNTGPGPSVLLIGGNHGDEYEGPIVMTRFIQAAGLSDFDGSLTVLPALNVPAVAGHRRCSPFDGGNLNRLYPGNAAGGPTDQIASLVSQEIIPRHDIVFDFHAGGTSMAHIGCGLTQIPVGDSVDPTTAAALDAMGLPVSFLIETDHDSPTALGQARRAGKIALGGEFGGGGSVTPGSVRDAAQALENVLLHFGVLGRRLISEAPVAPQKTRLVAFNRPELFVYANQSGWVEPFADIGEAVKSGQPAARIFDLLAPNTPPVGHVFGADGIVLARRLHTHCQAGDCLFALGAPL